MPIHNADIARLFDRIADLLELAGENPFRVRAYRNASRMLSGLGKNVRDMLAKGEDLTELPGIGDDLAGKIREAVETGSVDLLRRLEKKLPAGLPSLLALPGLGPKRVRMLYDQLHVSSVEELARAAEQGKLEGLPGLGPKTVAKIVAAIATKRTEERRYLVSEARPIAEDLVAHLSKARGLSEIVVAGSYRRGKETVGDLDVLVAAKGKTHVVERFVGYDEVVEVLARGDTRAAVRLRSGIQVDLRLVPEESFGAALHYFTGSKAHNVAVRKRAQERGLKLNEYGVFLGEERIAGETEASVFEAVGLPFVPPELREDRGELEAAAKGKLPELVKLEDLRGDLHVHTKATDGHATLGEMVAAAKEAGLSYLAVTEHSQRLKMVHGLDPDRLLAQVDAIAELNGSLKGFTVLAGIEVDVLEDGTLDLPDSVLSRLDLVVASVHGKFDLPREAQTKRILRAIENRHVSILGHPTGRLLLSREAYDFDVERVFAAAAEAGVVLEINAHPERLDLSDVHCRQAKELGARFAISTDAHSTSDFANLGYGVAQARRGWLEASDVVNTLPVAKLKKALAR
ncbi:MAG: DNA polymerase/3'-5' exonuclease PolX [Polyangiales bacterium]